MTAHSGSVTVRLHLTTELGGPVSLAEAEVPVCVAARPSASHAAELKVDERVLRHEIACALIDLANELDRD